MFIVYVNFIALACFDSHSDATDYVCEQGLMSEPFMIDFVEEDEDLWYSINSRA